MWTPRNNISEVLVLYSVLSCLVLIILKVGSFASPVQQGLGLGCGIALLNGLAHWASLTWAFGRSDKMFYGVLFGGIFWKLLLLAATAWFLALHPSFSLVAGLLSLALGTAALTFMNIQFLPKKQHGL